MVIQISKSNFLYKILHILCRQGLFCIIAGAICFGGVSAQEVSARQECPTCTSTPAAVMQRVDFTNRMIGISNNARIEGGLFSSRTTIGGFQGGMFQTIGGSLLKRLFNTITANLNARAQTLGAATFISASIATQLITKDGPLGFAVLFQSRPILRDYTLIQDLDSELSNTILDLGLAGGYMKTVNDNTLTAYNELIQEYKSGPNPLRDTSSRLDIGVSYDQVMTMLRRLNGRYKTFIATDNSNVFTLDRAYERNNGRIQMIFSSGLDSQLEKEYACVRGLVNQCSSQLKNFGDNMKKIGKNTALETKQSVSQIQTAFKKLKDTLSFKTNAYVEEILKDNKGYKGAQRGNANPLIKTNIDIPNPLSSSDKQLLHIAENKIETDVISRSEQQIDAFGSRRDAKSDSMSIISSQDIEKQIFADRMQLSRDNIETSQSMATTRARISDPKVTTLQLRDLSELVLDSMNLLGDSTRSNSIIANLKQACENQCTNKPGVCE